METIENHIADGFKRFGYIRDQKIFLKGFLHYPDRQIGEVRESEERSFQYFHERFKAFESKLDALFRSIDAAQNKGSYLQKLTHFKELIGKYDGLGDFEQLLVRIQAKEEDLMELIGKNRVKNLALKKALIDELAPLSASKDWINAGKAIKEIKEKWIKIGAVDKEHEEEIDRQFLSLTDNFYESRRKFYDELRAITQQRIEQYKSILARAEEYAAYPDPKKVVNEMKALTQEWKVVGRVPFKDLKLIQKSFKKVNKFYFGKLARERNSVYGSSSTSAELAQRIPLYLNLYNQLNDIKKNMPPGGEVTVKTLQTEWKKIGFVNDEDFKKMNNNFQSDCARLLDLYYLNKLCYKTNPTFYRLPPKELLLLKIELLRSVIEKDEAMVERFESTYNNSDFKSQSAEFDKVFGAKLSGQKKRLAVKHKLLQDFEREYNNVV